MGALCRRDVYQLRWERLRCSFSEEEVNQKSPLPSAPMEVPPPDPVEKEKERVDLEGDDDIGATEEISLN